TADGMRCPLVTGVQTCALPISVESGTKTQRSAIGCSVGDEVTRRRLNPQNSGARQGPLRDLEFGAWPSASSPRRLRCKRATGGEQNLLCSLNFARLTLISLHAARCQKE